MGQPDPPARQAGLPTRLGEHCRRTRSGRDVPTGDGSDWRLAVALPAMGPAPQHKAGAATAQAGKMQPMGRHPTKPPGLPHRGNRSPAAQHGFKHGQRLAVIARQHLDQSPRIEPIRQQPGRIEIRGRRNPEHIARRCHPAQHACQERCRHRPAFCLDSPSRDFMQHTPRHPPAGQTAIHPLIPEPPHAPRPCRLQASEPCAQRLQRSIRRHVMGRGGQRMHEG